MPGLSGKPFDCMEVTRYTTNLPTGIPVGRFFQIRQGGQFGFPPLAGRGVSSPGAVAFFRRATGEDAPWTGELQNLPGAPGRGVSSPGAVAFFSPRDGRGYPWDGGV